MSVCVYLRMWRLLPTWRHTGVRVAREAQGLGVRWLLGCLYIQVWDKAFYESLAQTKEDDDDFFSYLPQPRQRKVAPPVEHRRALQRRDFHIDLAKEIGKTKIVTLQTPRMQQGGSDRQKQCLHRHPARRSLLLSPAFLVFLCSPSDPLLFFSRFCSVCFLF